MKAGVHHRRPALRELHRMRPHPDAIVNCAVGRPSGYDHTWFHNARTGCSCSRCWRTRRRTVSH